MRTQWIGAALDTLRRNKTHADAAIAQVSDEGLRVALHPETNSIAVIMKHVAGNLRSRWTAFLTSDGEKADRDRDGEFVDDYADRAAILADWESGWWVAFDELARLTPEDAGREVVIRGHRLSVPHAVDRSMCHCSYHIGQIVMIARIRAGAAWRTLTIERGRSVEHNRARWGDASRAP